MVEVWTQILTVLGSVMASSGVWAYFTTRSTKKSASSQLLLGLAHDRIVYLGMSYLERGWITKDEYDDFIRYLYKPYHQFGGNGLAEKIMLDLSNLPIHKYHKPYVRKVQKYAEQTGAIPDQLDHE